MIKSLSPYYVNIPFVSPLSGLTCTSYTLQLFVWNGAKNAPPTNPSYEFTKSNPTGSTLTDEIDIANLISDYISFTPQEGIGTQLLDGNNQLWVKWRTFYTTTDSNDYVLPSNQNTKLMTKGYNYGMDGKNAETPTNKILLSGTEFKVNRQGSFVLPIEIEETTEALAGLIITSIVEDSHPLYDINFTLTGNIEYLYCRYRLDGVTDWTNVIALGLNTSPFPVELNVSSGNYEVQIYGFDNVNNENVYSNIYTITI